MPAVALERRYTAIAAGAMRGLPVLNPALRVRAVGFRRWGEHWLGVLVTPWFMNLVLMPRLPERWPAVGEREMRHFVFPAGVFAFIAAHDAEIGPHLSCSLFSPMFEFTDAAAAEATAAAALQALFDEGRGGAASPPVPDAGKRAFLLGGRGGHGDP